MDDIPMVSVVIPNLNRVSYLRQTIESVLSQDYPRVECIVVDGGSTDRSVQMLMSYRQRIQWISEPDQGHADAINKGWRMSRGDVLAWLNADDVYVAKNAISQAVTFLGAHPDTDVVYGDYVEIDVNGAHITERIRPQQWDLVRAVLYCDYLIPQASSFIRRRILEKVGWLNAEFRYCKDHELWLRIGLEGTIRHAPIFVAGVRRVPGISEHLGTSLAKVRLTEKFLSLPSLPSPFCLHHFRRRALSNAWLVGGLYALTNGYARSAVMFFARAATSDPGNLPYISFRLLRQFLSLVVPVRGRQAVKRVLVRLGLTGRVHRLPSVRDTGAHEGGAR